MSQATKLGIADVLHIVDIRTKIVSVSSLLIGTAYAFYATHAFAADRFVLMLLATLCVDMGTTGFNSYWDFLRGVDTADTDVEKWKALVQRSIDPAVAWRLSWLMFGLAAIFGLALGALFDWRVVPVGAVCMVVALLYSGGPKPIAGLPVGEVFAGGLLGFVLIVLSAFVQAGSFDVRAAWLGLPSTVLIATILSVNNACDIEGDRRAGRRTLAVALGLPRAERLIHLQAALTLLLANGLVPMGVLPVSALVPLALVGIIGWRVFRSMHRRGFSHATKAPSMGGISAVFMLYTLAILMGIALGAAGLP
jgi:1,4-dihydroxy-2-naphthoate polyprenyltransferase